MTMSDEEAEKLMTDFVDAVLRIATTLEKQWIHTSTCLAPDDCYCD